MKHTVYRPEDTAPETPKVKWTEQRILQEVFNMYENRDRDQLTKFVRKLVRGEIKADT